jgi:hypothetical protein
MITNLTLKVNKTDATIPYSATPSDYIDVDLLNDYLIWTNGSAVVIDGMTHEPSQTELTNASPVISPSVDVTVALCLLMDYSHPGGIYTKQIQGMGANARYVFAFSFDGATATEPQLEAWDDDTMTTINKNVLGAGTPANSMVKAVCTTVALPGTNWVGVAIAGSGSTRVVPLNAGLGALPVLGSGEVSQELYANIKIVIPANYSTPAIETFSLVVRYSWI